jgi:hypothetical membrane protein
MLKTRSAVVCGLLAPLLVGGLLIVCSDRTPNYNNLTQTVSELGFPGFPAAMIWNLGNIMVGGLIVVFAWGLYGEFSSKLNAMSLPILIGLSGIGWLGTGLFPSDVAFRPSMQTILHFIMVSIHYFAFLIAAFLLPIQLRFHPYWKRWGLFSGLIAGLAIASFFIPRSIPAGLSQRFGIGIYFVWIFGLSFALKFSTKATAHSSTQTNKSSEHLN